MINFKGVSYKTDEFIKYIIETTTEEEFISNYELYYSKYLFSKTKEGESLINDKNGMLQLKDSFLTLLLIPTHNAFAKLQKTPNLSKQGVIKKSNFQSKSQFILGKLQEIKEAKKLILDVKKEAPKETKKNLLNGKKLNILERFVIADSILDIGLIIRKKNILSADKNKLLSNILGCSEQTGRELLNGTYYKRMSVREDLISDYLKTFK